MPFKIFHVLISGSLFVQRSENICANLVEGIMSNMSNYYEFELVVQEEMSFKRCFTQSSGVPLAMRSGTTCAIFVKSIMENISVKLF